ncbi:MAG: hypothetical protein FWD26_02305 [Treponema sp.]|nr:hypothetical protein [Treponema sp.]
MLKSGKILLLLLVFVICFVSCQTPLPELARVNPNSFEDNDLKIEYAIGKNVHYISITNKTSSEIYLTDKSSIISINGQAKSLNFPVGSNNSFAKNLLNVVGGTNVRNTPVDTWFIPPRSKIVLETNQETFFDQNIYSDFIKDGYNIYYEKLLGRARRVIRRGQNNHVSSSAVNVIYNKILSNNDDIINMMRNRTIRLYFSFIINEREKIYDIPIRIEGAMSNDEIRRRIN